MSDARFTDNRILESLRCPCCASEMVLENSGRSLACLSPKRHLFDFSASGYVNLALSHSAGGDSREAVRSRTRFLDSGKYRPIADALCDMLSEHVASDGHIVDAGCGEGYYSCIVADKGFAVSGFDLSKDAVDKAAKRAKQAMHLNTFFGVASVFKLPMADSSADAVINIFAPCAEEEYSRVLADNGVLAVVYAGPRHLLGLKRALYDDVYLNEERSDMPSGMICAAERQVHYEISLNTKEEIEDLFSMTPYYWRTSREDKDKLISIDTLTTEIDVMIAIYKKQKEEQDKL